jgi:hypothetical protein
MDPDPDPRVHGTGSGFRTLRVCYCMQFRHNFTECMLCSIIFGILKKGSSKFQWSCKRHIGTVKIT